MPKEFRNAWQQYKTGHDNMTAAIFDLRKKEKAQNVSGASNHIDDTLVNFGKELYFVMPNFSIDTLKNDIKKLLGCATDGSPKDGDQIKYEYNELCTKYGDIDCFPTLYKLRRISNDETLLNSITSGFNFSIQLLLDFGSSLFFAKPNDTFQDFVDYIRLIFDGTGSSLEKYNNLRRSYGDIAEFPSFDRVQQMHKDANNTIFETVHNGFNIARENLVNFGKELFTNNYNYEEFVSYVMKYAVLNERQASYLYEKSKGNFAGFEYFPSLNQLIKISKYPILLDIIKEGYDTFTRFGHGAGFIPNR